MMVYKAGQAEVVSRTMRGQREAVAHIVSRATVRCLQNVWAVGDQHTCGLQECTQSRTRVRELCE